MKLHTVFDSMMKLLSSEVRYSHFTPDSLQVEGKAFLGRVLGRHQRLLCVPAERWRGSRAVCGAEFQ